MKSILTLFITVILAVHCCGQKLDSVQIKKLFNGEWADSTVIEMGKYDSHYLFMFWSIHKDTIHQVIVTDLDVDWVQRDSYYHITNRSCFPNGFPTKEGSGYFLKVAGRVKQDTVCYYIQSIDDDKMVLQTDAGGKSVTYKRVRK